MYIIFSYNTSYQTHKYHNIIMRKIGDFSCRRRMGQKPHKTTIAWCVGDSQSTDYIRRLSIGTSLDQMLPKPMLNHKKLKIC